MIENYEEILKFAIENDMIDINPICNALDEVQRKTILKNHKIWQGNRGYWYSYLDNGVKKKLIKRKEKEDLEDAIVEWHKIEDRSPEFETCFYRWAEDKLNHCEIQKQTYDRYINEYKKYLTELGKKRMDSITEDMLYDFVLDCIHNNNLTAKGWSNVRTLILGTFKYAKRKKYTQLSISLFMGDLDFSKGIYRKRRFKDEESVFNDDELKMIDSLIEQESDNLLALGVKLAMETGLRCGELSALEYSDLEGNVLHVTKTEVHYKNYDGGFTYEIRDSTKGKYDERNVVVMPCTIELIEKIHSINPDGKYLFEKDGKRIIGKCFSGKIKRMCKTLNIPVRSLHKCRKTYITKLANANVPKKVICGQVGHASFSTSENHYWFNNKTVDEVQTLITSAMA